MKNFNTFFYILVIAVSVNIIFVDTLVASGINPTFNMTVKNILRQPGPDNQDSIITFELYLQQTNQGQPGVYDFEYCCGQFTFRYNKLIHSPGGNLVFGIVPGASSLPPQLRPPSFQVDSLNGYLKASGNLPQSLANFFISGVYPGTRIITFKLRTNNKTFNMVPLNLSFKLGAAPNTFPAFFIPYPDSVDSEQFPNQYAVGLYDTLANHYSVEDTTSGGEISLFIPPEYSSTSKKYVNFAWESLNALSYKLQVSTDIVFNNIVYSDSLLQYSNTTVSGLIPGNTYYWKVSAKNDSQYFAESYIASFNVTNAQVSLINPQNNQTMVPVPVTFTWNNAGQVSSPEPHFLRFENKTDIFFDEENNAESLIANLDFGSGTTYWLEVSTDQNFNNIVFNDSTIVDSFKTVGNLISLTDYYWRVTPKNDSVYFETSASRKFTTNSIPVILNSPANNSTSLPLSVACSWYGLNNAVSYKLQVSTDQNFNNIILIDSAITDTFKTINNLYENTRYYWKIMAKNSTVYFANSQTWNFRTYNYLIEPTDNSITGSTTVNFLWHKTDNAVKYNLQVSKDPTLSNLIINDSTITDTFKTVSGLDSLSTYYWRIKAKDLTGYFFTSNIWNFRTTSSNTGVVYYVLLTGSREVPPVISTAYGILTGSYLYNTKTLSFQLTFSGLNAGSTSAHFHGPADESSNAPVQIDLTGFPTGVLSGNYFNTFVLTETQEAQLLAGLWYVNISSIANPNGEIRGQMIEEEPLPVELTNFNSIINKNNVTLTWSTLEEINNSGFDIERSDVKGQKSEDWRRVGNLEGNGTSATGHNYSFTENNLNTGRYKYRLKQIDLNGNFEYFYLSNEVEVGIPDRYTLSQNYPNPFNPATTIDFELPSEGKVSLVIYDISGKEIDRLVNELKPAGYYSFKFNASNLSSGIYFYMISVNDFRITKKMAVVK